MVIRQPQHHKLRHGLVRDPLTEMRQKLLNPQLVRKFEIEVWILRVEMPFKFRLGSNILIDKRNRPRIRTRPTAIIRRKCLALMDRPKLAQFPRRFRCPRQRRLILRSLARIIAELGRDKFAKVIERLAMLCQIVQM